MDVAHELEAPSNAPLRHLQPHSHPFYPGYNHDHLSGLEPAPVDQAQRPKAPQNPQGHNKAPRHPATSPTKEDQREKADPVGEDPILNQPHQPWSVSNPELPTPIFSHNDKNDKYQSTAPIYW